jgi:hypothetical protein
MRSLYGTTKSFVVYEERVLEICSSRLSKKQKVVPPGRVMVPILGHVSGS